MISPDLKSVQMALNSLPFPVAVVIHTWLPNITGDDQPFPGIADSQLIFVESFQEIGTPVSDEIPFKSLPRKWVHDGWEFCATETIEENIKRPRMEGAYLRDMLRILGELPR